MRVEGACHCRAVRFAATLPEGLASARRCNCSFCAMRGAVAVSAPLDAFEITQGAADLTLYTFNSGTAQHYFCGHCGIYTHHRRRSNPNEFGINLACIEDQSPFLARVDVLDGRDHPGDTTGMRVAGMLKYEGTP